MHVACGCLHSHLGAAHGRVTASKRATCRRRQPLGGGSGRRGAPQYEALLLGRHLGHLLSGNPPGCELACSRLNDYGGVELGRLLQHAHLAARDQARAALHDGNCHAPARQHCAQHVATYDRLQCNCSVLRAHGHHRAYGPSLDGGHLDDDEGARTQRETTKLAARDDTLANAVASSSGCYHLLPALATEKRMNLGYDSDEFIVGAVHELVERRHRAGREENAPHAHRKVAAPFARRFGERERREQCLYKVARRR